MQQQIENSILTESDKGSKVTYIPPHANGDASHEDAEGGVISSWNNSFIFVEFGTGTAKACRPENLVWG